MARFRVRDSALADMCKWDCEVGTADLFPFDVPNKCEVIHRSRRLGRPSSRLYRAAGPRRTAPCHHAPRRPYFPQPARPKSTSRPFLGHRLPQGRGMQLHR